MLLNWSKGFKLIFKTEMELFKQEMEFFLHFQASDEKYSFTKWFSFIPRGSK